MSYVIELRLTNPADPTARCQWTRTIGLDDGAVNLHDVIAQIGDMAHLVEDGDVAEWAVIADGARVRVTADKERTIVVDDPDRCSCPHLPDQHTKLSVLGWTCRVCSCHGDPTGPPFGCTDPGHGACFELVDGTRYHVPSGWSA